MSALGLVYMRSRTALISRPSVHTFTRELVMGSPTHALNCKRGLGRRFVPKILIEKKHKAIGIEIVKDPLHVCESNEKFTNLAVRLAGLLILGFGILSCLSH